MNDLSPSPHLQPFSLRAPAKINWFLKIIGKRDDGYHDLVSVMQCVNLYDELTFEQADTLELISDMDIPLMDNLVYRAAYHLKKQTSYRKGARIILQKNIPHGAGLGGGSSDAACTLRGLKRLWGLKLNNMKLFDMAATIGSDVPFFLDGPCSLVEGRGEKLSPLKISSSAVLLLVKPPVPVSTADAYASWDKTKPEKLTKKPIDIKLLVQVFTGQAFDLYGRLPENDLEQIVAAQYPVIREIKTQLLNSGAIISAMTGSGSAVYGLFRNREHAEKSADAMKSYWCRVVDTLI
jgi:4-diphosphocytidyl-2-C-methyl-D-erythritol kinase